MQQIRMQSTFIQIGLTIEDPVQRMEPSKVIQSIEQPQATLHIERTPGRLTIDQAEAWEQMDIKHIFQRTAELAQEGKQKVLEGIARRSRQGDDMMHIERGGNVLGAHAKQNSERPTKQFNIGWIPSPFSVKTHYEQAKLNIEAQTHKPVIDVQIQKTIHDYTPGSVKMNVTQENSLNIDVVNV
ncbi:DUF6470 family protein [Peribacillus asahii]|uniref:DUF6470 family protein n=1 Tax=Peribacillus asahii TaxID=228899 RepID=UPI00381BD26D